MGLRGETIRRASRKESGLFTLRSHVAKVFFGAVTAALVSMGTVAPVHATASRAQLSAASHPQRKRKASIPADMTRAQIRASLVSRGMLDVHVSARKYASRGVSSAGFGRLALLPMNTFHVWSQWSDWMNPKNGKIYVEFLGNWKFKKSFAGAGDPDDISAIALRGFPTRCWTMVHTKVVTRDDDGRVTKKRSYRKRESHARSVWGVQDRAQGFNLLNRYGTQMMTMRRDHVRKGCKARKAGSYFYEHNQGGNGGWSASVGVGALNVSYSASPSIVLQKAARYHYYK